MVPDDPVDLRDAIYTLLTNGALAQQMGINAHLTINEQYSVETIIRKLIRIYKELLHN